MNQMVQNILFFLKLLWCIVIINLSFTIKFKKLIKTNSSVSIVKAFPFLS